MKPRHKKIRLILGAIVIICGLVSLLALYASMSVWQPIEGGCLAMWGGPDNPEAMKKSANLVLPSSTENLFTHSTDFQDCITYVRFDMASANLDSFLTSTLVAELHQATDNELKYFLNYLPQNIDWSFDSDKSYLYGEGDRESREHQSIVIDPTNPDTYIVYVIAFQL